VDEPVDVDGRADVRIACTSAMAIRAILRPGYLVTVLDMSAGGALIQGPRPLRPGARVQLRLVSAARALALTAHVVRCAVWALDAEVGVVYRGALQFDQRCDWFEEPVILRVSSASPAATEDAIRLLDGRDAEHGPG
jgi:PilZ domain-containing protein